MTTREFIKSLGLKLTDKQITKMVWRVRFWKVLRVFGIRPRLRTWERHYFDQQGNKQTIYFINRSISFKRLEDYRWTHSSGKIDAR